MLNSILIMSGIKQSVCLACVCLHSTLVVLCSRVFISPFRTWSLPDPEKVPRAIVFMSHGFSEHLGLYHLLGNAFQVKVQKEVL